MPKINKPGIYDIPFEEYLADPCETASLSTTILKALIDETPMHAQAAHPRLNPDYQSKDDGKFDIGKFAHSVMLRDPQDVVVIEAADYKGKAAQQARKDARAEGKIPLLTEQYERVMAMVESGRAQMASSLDFAGVFQNGQPEKTLIWSEGEGKDLIWCRCRLDWLPDDLNEAYVDYKTSEISHPQAWVRGIMLKVGHDIQAAWHKRGIKALGLHRNPVMRFIVQEPTDPFALSGVEVGGEIMELAEREIEKAIARWRLARSLGYWPGHTGKFVRAEAPAFLESNRMEREVAYDEAVKAAGGERALFEASFRRQSPDPRKKLAAIDDEEVL